MGSKGAEVIHKKHGRPEDPGTKADDETVPVPVAVVTSRMKAELIVGICAVTA